MKDFLKIVFGSCLGVIIASVVSMIIFFSVLGSAFRSISSSFSTDTDKKTVTLTEGSVLLLDLAGEVKDQTATDYNSFYSFGDSEQKTYTLPEVLKALEVAKTNSDISAIVLRLDEAQFGFATAKEIREALLEVGKPIYAYSDLAYGYGNYYLSSTATELFANPETVFNIAGLSSSVLFQKGFLEKLGVKTQVFKVGTFKGAVEPYMRDNLSEENRFQIQTYLDGLWNGTKEEIAAARGFAPETLQAFADSAFFMGKADKAVELGLADSVVYRTDIEKVLAAKIAGDADAELNYVRVGDLLPHYDNGDSSDEVAVVYAEGNIVDVEPDEDNPFATNVSQIDYRIAEELHELIDEESVKAVVLRVNSGGGSARMSELICREVKELKKAKPVVVSMGNMAASGGYYISSNADYILAEPYTLTGSIGIFGVIPEASGLASKLALRQETVKTAEFADFPSMMRPMTDREKEILQGYINQGYDTFITRVSEGRGLTKAQVDSIGQGRVWLGKDALDRKLVDKIGGLEDAVIEAARRADLEDYTIRDVTQTKDFMDEFKSLFGLGMSVREMISGKSAEELLLDRVEYELRARTGVMAVPPVDLEGLTKF